MATFYPLLPDIPEKATDFKPSDANGRICGLAADGSVCGDTAGVDGDLASGVWEFNARLYAPRVKQSLNIAVLTGVKGPGIPVVSVTLKVAELLARVKACPNGHQDFDIFDSGTPIQLKLVMTCSIKLSSILGRFAQAVGDEGNSHNRSDQYDLEPRKVDLTSQDDLESPYVKTNLPPDHGDNKARQLSLLGCRFYVLYEEEHEKAVLEKAITIHEKAMQFTGLFHPHLAVHADRFAVALLERFQQSGDHTDIERAISYSQTALRFTEDLDAAKPFQFSNLGKALQLRFQRFGDRVDLENSILYQREAIGLMPDGHPSNPELFNDLAVALLSRFEHFRLLTDLEDAISNLRLAVQLTPDGHPDNLSRFSNLGVAFIFRFERLDDVEDLEDAISNLRQAGKLTQDCHPDKPRLFNNLGVALQSRFARLGDPADLEDAISNLRQADQLTPDDHPKDPRLLNSFGLTFVSRFRRLGDLGDLEDAISNLQHAVQLTPDDHPNRPGLFNTLGTALLLRFGRLGGLGDLEDAISKLRQAIQLTPDSYPGNPIPFTTLGIALQSRYERLGVVADLEDAISNLRQAVQLTPDGHTDKPIRVSNLGNALRSRFECHGILADSDDSISNLRQAVQLTQDGHPDRMSLFSNLGLGLRSRFERLGVLADLEDAISNLRQAIQLTQDGHPARPSQFNHLGLAVLSRFESLGVLADLEDAISSLQTAVELAPDGDPNGPCWFNNLGDAFLGRFRRLGIPSDLESGISALSTAANSTSGSAMERFKAARAWAKVTEEQARSPLDAFSCAIDLLPRIAWLGLAVPNQHGLLADVGGIVRDAVAAAIRYEKYETAVEWAEQGRSIVWQNLLGLRSPVDDLHETHPELADRLRRISKQLEGSGSHLEVPMASAGDFSLNYSKLATEWDSIVEEVRKIPRFKDFLKAKSFRQLAPAAHEGPVVILNVNDAQCDALVLIADGSNEKQVSVVNIPLKRFSDETSKNLFHSLTSLLTGAGVRVGDARRFKPLSHANDEAKFKDILRILWQDIVKPVLEGLRFQAESKRPPRIWWCMTGSLAFLPIHAAGLYDTPEVGERISEYVISSYTPTLNAILELSSPVAHEDFQVLTVAQASAPGAPEIPKTENEVGVVQRLTDGAHRVNLMGENATVERLREEMKESNWIHLACHGQQDPDDPMESGFLLHGNILKLSEIVKMSLPKADFAFLSACQTAMGDEKIAEESVHLAAGMLLSGCRGVIATIWSILDEDGPKIAEDVYSRIFKDGKPNRKEAAYALHEAVKRLRESGAKCTSWVPFIHIGR